MALLLWFFCIQVRMLRLYKLYVVKRLFDFHLTKVILAHSISLTLFGASLHFEAVSLQRNLG